DAAAVRASEGPGAAVKPAAPRAAEGLGAAPEPAALRAATASVESASAPPGAAAVAPIVQADRGPPFFRRPGEGTGPPPAGPDGGPVYDGGARAPSAAASVSPGPPKGTGGPCTDDMVLSGSACVDRHEAFLVTIDEGGAETLWPHHQRPRAGVAYAARNAAGFMPQAYISRNEAEAACGLAGKRLCSLAEWQRACQGSKALLFPYGKAYQKGACNSGKAHLLSMFFGTNGNAWKYEEHFNSPRLDQQPGFLARSGEYAACASDEGTRDMVGNLHEWIADRVERVPFDPARVAPGPRRPVTRVGNGIFMGGFFSTTDEHGAGCTFITKAHETAYHDYSVGFRCCRDPGAR
ncbi:MAG TPA: SUMF1/EgtB/PvdO family nonheme iron enzyme, partial [Polyangiaceae bacterium]|nr:SUMF1/EgtB/PvdO family nonheme iron enzyme [Polyangiaceae bacterium]